MRITMSYLDQIKVLKFKVSKVTVDGVDFYLRELSDKARVDFEGEKIYSFVSLR